MTNVWMFVAPGFQDEEVIYPYYRFLEMDAHVICASATGEVVHGKYGVPARVTHSFEQLLEEELPDCLFLPGGFESPDRLRMLKEVQYLTAKVAKADRLVAAICHGPWIMISAEIVEGRRMTAYESIQVDVSNAGGVVTQESVVVDRNFITADHYRSNGRFMAAVVRYLESIHTRV